MDQKNEMNPAPERLDKIIAAQGIASRSEAKSLIRRGFVTVRGEIVRDPEEKVDPAVSEIAVRGMPINYRRHLYIMMNKPAGVLSASRDKNSETVIDLLPPALRRRGLFPAGRLDRDTRGFVLITDDGELAHKMLSPKSHVYKLYEAKCDRKLTEKDVESFARGITFGEESFLPAEMKITAPDTALVEICEGKFHQIKKMFASVGATVTELRRLRIGEVELDPSLAPGMSRELTREEINVILSQKHGI